MINLPHAVSRRAPIFMLASLGLGLAIASFQTRARFIWNFTASAPIGLYRVLDRPWTRGDWVAARPSPALANTLAHLGVLEPGRLLIKRIAAGEDDRVCRSGTIVTINGVFAAQARLSTSSGAPLPARSGCVRLNAAQVFLLGEAEGSFDGRYFGISQQSEIVAAVSPLSPRALNTLPPD